MYIRTTKRQNKDGSLTEYLQLAHNEWDKQARRSFGGRLQIGDCLKLLLSKTGYEIPIERALFAMCFRSPDRALSCSWTMAENIENCLLEVSAKGGYTFFKKKGALGGTFYPTK